MAIRGNKKITFILALFYSFILSSQTMGFGSNIPANGGGGEGLSLFDEFVIINIENSDNIVIIGDSYTESCYTLRDKSYISKLSERTSYQLRNYGLSGDDIIEAILRINANTKRYSNDYGIKDFNSKYAIIALYANDSPYRYWSFDMYKENLRQLVQRVRDLGMTPIISTEFFLYNFFFDNNGVADTALIYDLANELNVDIIDVAGTSMNFIKTKESDFWNGSHPATRTNSVMWRPMLNFIKSLPEPQKSVKIYRNRIIDSNFFTETLFKNEDEKLEKYQEISVGHSALTSANEIYFDRQSEVSAPIFEQVNDEYLKLMNNEEIPFSRQVLFEFTVPYSANNIDQFRFKYTADTLVHRWIRKKKTPFSSAKGTSFKYTGSPSIVVGDTYLVSSSDNKINGQTITVSDVRNGYICADGLSYNYPSIIDSGTLTRQSGTGEASVSFDGVLATFDDDYYSNYDNSYEWVQDFVLYADGFYYVDNTNQEYVEGDKIYILLRQVEGFNLSDIRLDVPKVDAEKIYTKRKELIPLSNGTELLSQNKMGDSGQLSDWDVTGTIAVSQPIGNANPRGTIGKVRLTDTNSISQDIGLIDSLQSTPVQIKIWANYEPDKFEGVDLSASPINKNTFDESKLLIELYSDGVEPVVIEKSVGLGFQEVLINTVLPPDMISPKIRLKGTEKTIDVSYVSVKK